jgi:flavin-dependent thymidylate synthase
MREMCSRAGERTVQVKLISYTPDALNLLLGTKNTRLANTDDDPATWSDAKRLEHLAYMRDTIKSSWEFCDYVFEITGVTRAFTHQLVRTRTGSYAQEAMRVINASDHEVMVPDSLKFDGEHHGQRVVWDNAIQSLMDGYSDLLASGVAAQEARGLLPTNITTSIKAKFNLRTLHETAKLRLCTRTQGEYQDVFREMRRLVGEVHPWALDFLDVYCAAHGTCAFPRYGKVECPIYKFVIPQEQLDEVRTRVRAEAETTRYEASPVAKDGKAM